MELGFVTEQKQTMKLSSAQLQMIEILQMSSLELEQRVQNELTENPVLEADEQWNSDSSIRMDSYRESVHASNAPDDAEGVAAFDKFYIQEDTLTDHLMKQLHAISCPDNVRRACRFVIYSLDDNGFLDMTPKELEEASENTAEEFAQAIPIVQSMDPAGIAAANLEECLRLQLDPDDEMTEDACKVIGKLSDIASGNFREVIKQTGITMDRLKAIIEIIRKLDPKPGVRFSSGNAQKYVTPDVLAEIDGGDLVIRTIGRIPHLKLSEYYTDLAKSSDDKEVTKYLRDRIDSANLLIRNIEQRNRTIISVTRSILARQDQFLQNGDKALKPLTMQEVADEIGVNVSTVSRAVNDKYIKCPAGTFALKHFFTGEVAGGTRDSVLKRIKELIAEEDPAKPLSDQKIADILVAENIDISRRTVAKYRDEAWIPPASGRKKRI
ncbi:MAG: RNA polymerase factor sigma-54 [Mogibacterium sp.]|nr:RNA polymerase factor sigma-54 [Mogibacterium sp.]